VEFEPTVPASERAKTMHALDRTATVTGPRHITGLNIHESGPHRVHDPQQVTASQKIYLKLILLIH
jgi:hypothetical protein